ncbi:SNF2-related protein [Rubrobacter aplysinae]|uniref:SNF2-related protein n=1 Tax=Rubrobacter aplysinae TaxID=909625 RepID=UPI001364BB54|nr:SNF2-related protein [Rubrobacter aplysinae]
MDHLSRTSTPATGTLTTPPILDAPAIPDEDGDEVGTPVPQSRTASRSDAKRGKLRGGAATDEALSSSRRVLTNARGNKAAFIGLQQYFAPIQASRLIAEVLGERTPVLDPTAGSGSLLAAFNEAARYGIEIDGDHAGAPEYPYTAIQGDSQKVVPMLRAGGTRFPALALNPPFGLDWRDAGKSKSNINSTVLAFLWSLDLMERFGQGAMVCGTDRLATAVLSREVAAGVYAVVDVEGPLFEGVQLPSSIAFYVSPANTNRAPGERPARLSARREELPELAEEVVAARRRHTPHVMPYSPNEEALASGFRAVRREYQSREKTARSKARANRYDLTLKGSKVSVGISAFSKLALANTKGSRTVREIELLGGQHVSYFGQNPRTLRQLRELRDEEALTLDPALEEAADKALAEAEKVSTPLFTLKPQMRLGWLTDLDFIRCKKTDPERGFEAGENYALSTNSKIDQQTESRVVEDKDGVPELRQFQTERRLLEVKIGRGSEQQSFDEGPENIAYLIEHFEIPDPGSVAEKFPEEVGEYRRLLEEIADENGFTLKEFQIDHLSRLLTKRRGVLAHEQGLGKSLQLMVLAEATVRLGAKNQVLFVAPQDLLRQWGREYKKFFGSRVHTPEEVRENVLARYKADAERYAGGELEEIRTPAKAREVAKRMEAGEEGWFITYYECLSIVGRKKEVLPEEYVDHRAALGGRLYRYKLSKGSPTTIPGLLGGANTATTADACPSCGADTDSGWDGEVCRGDSYGYNPGCGYVHRSVYRKAAYTHLTTAFKQGVRCIDEISEVRGDDSLRSKSLRALARGPHIYGATGTPLSNFLADAFWGLYICLGNATPAFPYDYHGGKAKFEDDFCVTEHMMGRAEDGEANQRKRRKILPQVANVSQFWRLAQPAISRCRKEQTGEPLVERTYHPVRVPMGAAQKRANRFWLSRFGSYFEWKFPNHPMVEKGLVDKWAAALGQLWRLETAATLPASDEPSREWPEAREELGELSNFTPATLKVLELVMEHVERGEKVLVGSDLIMTGKWIADRLQEKGIKAVHITEEAANGAISTKNPRKRSREIEQFVEGDAQVLCAGVAAVKLGHNLDVSSTVIVHGLPYSFSVMDQFIARVHRLTSKKPVSVYSVIPKGSLAERKYELLSNKGAASDLAFDGELQVQPEQATDWSKVLKEMQERGIRALGEDGEADPEGETVAEEDVEAAWRAIAPLAPQPSATPGTTETPEPERKRRTPELVGFSHAGHIENPHSYEQPALF